MVLRLSSSKEQIVPLVVTVIRHIRGTRDFGKNVIESKSELDYKSELDSKSELESESGLDLQKLYICSCVVVPLCTYCTRGLPSGDNQ